MKIFFGLTGYDEHTLQRKIMNEVNFETFFRDAPHINPDAELIKGVICGHRVEEIEDVYMRHIRHLDKIIDELAKGKAMKKLLRS